jgi:ribose transport system substrate-binding protein
LRKITMGIAAVAAVALTLTGCASGSNDGTDTGSGDTEFVQKDPLVIGYSVMDLADPYWGAYIKGLEAQAATYDAKIVTADSKGQETLQVSGAANLINQGISALIISPIQPSALPATVTAAHDAKIPVIVGDVGAEGDYDAYLLSDNYNGGVLAAQYVINAFKDKPGTHQVGIISLLPEVAVGKDRVDGFVDTLEKEGNGNFEVVGTLVGQTVDDSFKSAQDMLTANPDIEAFYGANGNSALGASKAAIAAGKDPANGFVLIGFNGDPGELDAIESGAETATIAQDPYGQGKQAVDMAMTLLGGKKLTFDDEATKTVTFPVAVVDASSLDAYRQKLAAQ